VYHASLFSPEQYFFLMSLIISRWMVRLC
jgi:hypothetical protein